MASHALRCTPTRPAGEPALPAPLPRDLRFIPRPKPGVSTKGRPDELFAAQVAYAYLHASGIRAKVSSRDAIALTEEVVAGHRDVRQVAEALKNWG
ncbi:hypothetical protein [Streptomyces sp. WAC 01325]|uniref:hypothetical protein n=1 Tax=Streptomyces sp. WAC 01325 TaxID=2203202 RepID=UPI000F874AC5|nr:hypothetical protein [Streptomyces sp. WAC 01325]